jgi:hypothetical protein
MLSRTETQRLQALYPCPACGRVPDDGDLSWQVPQTPPGTTYTVLDLICAACDTSIVHLRSWWPGVHSAADAWDLLAYEGPHLFVTMGEQGAQEK